MNIKEAKQALAEGKKVSHSNFTDDEFVQGLPDGNYVFEDGCKCSPVDFWNCRETMDSFKDGWYFVLSTKEELKTAEPGYYHLIEEASDHFSKGLYKQINKFI